MIKKSLALTLALVYSLAVVGMPINYHYCKGDLQHIGFLVFKLQKINSEVEDRVCCVSQQTSCDAQESDEKACCDNRIELEKSDLPSVLSGQPLMEDFRADVTQLVFTTQSKDDTYQHTHLDSIDPPWTVPIYLMHCALVVYG